MGALVSLVTKQDVTRDMAIQRIKAALKARSGKSWSVTGGKGTAWGWIKIDAPPARRTWHFVGDGVRNDIGHTEYAEENQPGKLFGHMSPAERQELADLLGLGRVHHQGESIPASSAYYREYIDRAEGRNPAVCGTMYWD